MTAEKKTAEFFYYDPERKDKAGSKTENGVVEVVDLNTLEIVETYELPKRDYFRKTRSPQKPPMSSD